MDQATCTSDEQTGRKLLHVVAATENSGLDNPGLDNPGLDNADSNASTSQLTHRQTGGERTPLIRPRTSTDPTEDSTPDNSDSGFPRIQYGTIPFRQTPPVEVFENNPSWIDKIRETLAQPTNSFMTLMLIVIIGVVLEFAANLRTDQKGAQVKPQHVLMYLIFLIVVFILWTCLAVIPQKLHYSRRHDGTLIPSHLLTGIGIFGTVSAGTQILSWLDFIKCSRHVDGLSYVYAFYPVFKIFFVFFQIYFFYKLSRDGIRHASLPWGPFFVMVTLATNLCIWVSAFFTNASSDPKLKEIAWLNHYYYGVESHDHCANASINSPASRDLHALLGNLHPYSSTFSMEYALLASGLLLHIWMVIKSPIPKVPKPMKQEWTLWRVGFILGLLAIPVVFVTYMKEEANLRLTAPKVTLNVLKAGFFLALMVLCLYCISQVKERSGFIKKTKPTKLEIVLLGISGFLGFPAYDLACVFAAICEWQNYPPLEVSWYGICSLCELFSITIQFFFIKKAYQFKLPEVASDKVKKAAGFIRQYASFALVVNIAYWAATTYELRRRRSDDPSIAEQFFGKYTWFALSHFSFPLCIFFYFHLAICYANVVSSFSQFGPLWARNTNEDE